MSAYSNLFLKVKELPDGGSFGDLCELMKQNPTRKMERRLHCLEKFGLIKIETHGKERQGSKWLDRCVYALGKVDVDERGKENLPFLHHEARTYQMVITNGPEASTDLLTLSLLRTTNATVKQMELRLKKQPRTLNKNLLELQEMGLVHINDWVTGKIPIWSFGEGESAEQRFLIDEEERRARIESFKKRKVDKQRVNNGEVRRFKMGRQVKYDNDCLVFLKSNWEELQENARERDQ